MTSPDWLDRLERRYGHLVLPNLISRLMMLKLAVWVLVFWKGNAVLVDLFQSADKAGFGLPASCLISFIAPPGSDSTQTLDIFWAVIINIWMMMSFSRLLEECLGAFRFALLMMLYFLLQGVLTYFAAIPFGSIFMLEKLRFSFIFISFGLLAPNFVIHLWGILPVRAALLAAIDALLHLGLGAQALYVGDHWSSALWIASPAVFAGFILGLPRLLHRAKHKARHVAFERKASIPADKSGHFHRCSVCGITDKDDRETHFRVGSDGEDYCEKHLR